MNERRFETHLTELFRQPTPHDVRVTAVILRGLEKRSRRREGWLIAAAVFGVAISVSALITLQVLPALGTMLERASTMIADVGPKLSAMGVSTHWLVTCVGFALMAAGALYVWRES